MKKIIIYLFGKLFISSAFKYIQNVRNLVYTKFSISYFYFSLYMKDNSKSIEAIEEAYYKIILFGGLTLFIIEKQTKRDLKMVIFNSISNTVALFRSLGFSKMFVSYFSLLSGSEHNVLRVGVRDKISKWFDRVSKSLISSISPLFRTLLSFKFKVYFLSRSEFSRSMLKRRKLSESGKVKENYLSRSFLPFPVRGCLSVMV